MPAKSTASPHVRWARPVVQACFLIGTVLIGIQFHRFVTSLADPTSPVVTSRPPAVEGFLPISSLMSLTYLQKTGVANLIHPAGLVLFSLTLVLALVMRRGFCSWICPVGTVAEVAHKGGARLFGRNLRMPGWLDVPLRGVKYLLLGFFLYAILRMSAEALRMFIYGPYNRVADVKMYVFFAKMSAVTAVVLLVLVFLSMLFKNFWCRYLCPYGALLGLVSKLSPVAVRRDTASCIDCGACTRACPNRIAVAERTCVRSAECTACYSCVGACPKPGTLQMAATQSRGRLPAIIYGAITVAAMVLVPLGARAIGYWQTSTPAATYRQLYAIISEIDHPRSITIEADDMTPAVHAEEPQNTHERTNAETDVPD